MIDVGHTNLPCRPHVAHGPQVGKPCHSITRSGKMFFSREDSYISHYFLCISLLKNTKFPTKWSHFPGRRFLISTFFPTMSITQGNMKRSYSLVSYLVHFLHSPVIRLCSNACAAFSLLHAIMPKFTFNSKDQQCVPGESVSIPPTVTRSTENEINNFY